MSAPASLRLAAQMVAVLLAALTLALLWGLATSATDRVASQPFRSQPFRVAYEPFEFRASQPFRVASQPFASQPF
jgi:hypothetical protein